MRTRSTSTPGFPRMNLPTRTYHNYYGDLPGSWASNTVDTPEEPLWHYSLMTDDIKRNDYINHDVTHFQRMIRLGGYVPHWRPAFTQPYVAVTSSAVGINHPLHEVPTATILGTCLQAFPEIAVQPDLKRLLNDKLDYVNWSRGEWTGPKASLSDGFSLVNFLLEYRETLRLADSWLSKRGLIDRWHALMARNESLPTKAKALANERLAYVYGTRLFIADARQLFRILVSWRERADKYLADAGKVKQCYRTPLAWSASYSLSPRPITLFDNPTAYAVLGFVIELEAHAHIDYSYSVPNMSGLIARLAQLSDSLGVRLDPGIVWDAIPYSFVVDWFINVSEWLHSNLGHDWLEAEVILHEHAFSGRAKVERALVAGWENIDAGGFPINTGHSLYTDIHQYYHRERTDIPRFTKTNLDLSSGWRVQRIINAAALAAQKVLKTRRVWPNPAIQELTKKAKAILTQYQKDKARAKRAENKKTWHYHMRPKDRIW